MKQLYIVMVLVIMSVMCATAQGDAGQWSQVTLIPGRTFEMTARGLCSDAQGRLHLAYGESDLFYAMYDGTQWHVECVDDTSGAGRGASIQVDSNGVPWICYTDHSTQILKLAQKSPSGWQISIIDENVSSSVTATLKLDGNYQPHVGYVRDGEPEQLVYADRPGSQWQYTVFDEFTRNDEFNHCRLILNNRDEPFIQCSDTGYYYLDKVWRSYEIPGNAIMADENRALHWVKVSGEIGYHYQDIVYHNRGTALFDSAGLINRTDHDCTLMKDQASQVHCFYMQNERVVKHATRRGLLWHVDTIAELSGGFSSSVAAVQINGVFHCVVFDTLSGEMIHFENSSGQWFRRVIDVEQRYGRYQCFDLDADEHCHLVYSDPLTDEVTYMTDESGSWESESIATIEGIETAPMSLRTTGTVLVGLYHPGQERIWLYQRSEEGFMGTAIPGYFSHVYSLNAMYSSSGILYCVYRSEDGWFVTNNAEGSWNTIPVGIWNPSGPDRLTVDLIESSGGKIYLGITDFKGYPVRFIYEVFANDVVQLKTQEGKIGYADCHSPCVLAVDRWGYLHDFRVIHKSYSKGYTGNFYDYSHYFYDAIGYEHYWIKAEATGDISMDLTRNGQPVALMNNMDFLAMSVLNTSNDYERELERYTDLPLQGRPQPVTLKLDGRDYPVVCHSVWGDLTVSRKIPPPLDLQLTMPNIYYEPGSEYALDLSILNSGNEITGAALWCILEIADQFYYWPDWTQEPAFQHVDIAIGETTMPLIEPFNWPETGDNIIGRNHYYAALLNHDNTEILDISSGIEVWIFNYGPELNDSDS